MNASYTRISFPVFKLNFPHIVTECVAPFSSLNKDFNR